MLTKELPAGAGFGELALIYNDKRSASIIALEECEVYSLDGTIFKKLITQTHMAKRSNHAAFLNSIQLFDALDKQQKLKLVDGLQQITIEQDQYVFKQGDKGAEFYIVEKGAVACIKEDTSGEEVHVRSLGASSHFGELALINNEARSLSVKATTYCQLLKLDRESFTRILGSIEKYLSKDYNKQ